MAATTRNKAPARWTTLLLSGVASAGFLWAIVSAPGPGQDATSAQAAVQPAAPTSLQVVSGRGEDDQNVPASVLVPSTQLPSTQFPSTVQPSTSTITRQPRLRTRGS